MKIHKIKIYSFLLLFFTLSFTGFGQSESINFLWNDQENNERNASLVLNWNHNETVHQWELHIAVNWMDASGEVLTNPSAQPFLFLSEYDIEIVSDNDIKCFNFDVSQRISDMQFQDKGVLRFSIPPEIEAPGSLVIKFGYSLSEADIENANIDPVKIPGRDELRVLFPDTRIPEDDPVGNPGDTSGETKTQELTQVVIDKCVSVREKINGLLSLKDNSSRQLSEDDKSIGIIRIGIDDVSSKDSIRQGQYEEELQAQMEVANLQIAGIDSGIEIIRDVRKTLDNGNLPPDSLQLYRGEVNRLDNDISGLRGEYVAVRVQIRRMLGELGSTYDDMQLTAMKKSLEEKYSGLLNMHIDSLESIQTAYSTVEPDLNAEIDKGPRKAYKSQTLQGLRDSHELLSAKLDSVERNYKAAYFKYREEIVETDPIPAIETINIHFDDTYGNINNRINNMDLKISRLVASMNDQIIKPAPTGVIIGGSIFIIGLIIFLIILTTRRRREREAAIAHAAKTEPEAGEFSLIDDSLEESVEYYKMIVPDDKQDIMVSEVHFHLRVIKSIYHLIQGALLEKKPDNFGGLMFGRQYKGNGNGDAKSIVIVERIVPAEQIRPNMDIGLENSDLLVDEIEELVAENKKMALLGWFTSSTDSDNEMPDNLVKIHRTYFSEKWQIASLIYPGSDHMNSGMFIRRKSGYFDTVPSDGFRLSWDELYQFAVDPPSKKVLEEKKRPDLSEYVKIELNQNWCESIVEHLFIHPDVLNEIATEKESRVQMVAGQKASGFLYGEVYNLSDKEGFDSRKEFEIFINKFTIATSSENPRELPGSELLGWIKIDEDEIFETLKVAIPYHEEVFKSPFQVCALLNSNTSEIRFFSRKQNLEMNNNTIETEEFNLNSLIS